MDISMHFLCISVIAALLATPSAAVNCNNNRCTQSGRQQTLCVYQNPQPAAACGRVWSTGFTQQEKDEIVNTHNTLRQNVAAGREMQGKPGPQPPAANMQWMSWDDEIAEVAQRWANQCSFGHDRCRDVDRFAVGQNVGMIMTTGNQNSKPSDIVRSWYNEVKDMDRNTVSNYQFVPSVGHYTQLVWGNTNKVGCGKIVYQEGNWNKYYMVCNYGPAGNWIGQPIYQIRH